MGILKVKDYTMKDNIRKTTPGIAKGGHHE